MFNATPQQGRDKSATAGDEHENTIGQLHVHVYIDAYVSRDMH